MSSSFPVQMNITLAKETAAHREARDSLIEECFSTPQQERAAHRLRAGTQPIARYSRVALHEGILVGSIRFSPLLLPDKTQTLMLGPLAVEPLLRGNHIGKQLVTHGLSQLRANNERGVIVIGDAGYFTGLGFAVKVTQNLIPPGIVAPLHLMGIEWQEGFLSQQSGALAPLNA